MTGILNHILLLFMLAVVCYVIGIAFADSRLGFIVFFVAGLIAEFVFWILFWRQRGDSRRRRASSHA
jgi:hypothetical protein